MSDKILKLSQAQTLYQDLRGRIDALPTDSDIPEVPVQDVQVNGTSVLDAQGVANVPIASRNNLGVIQPGSDNFLTVNANGVMTVSDATEAQCKSGTSRSRAITPSIQNASTFYGLAKAAGDTTQSQSSNNVGNYTDNAKEKIQSMLGISQMFGPENSNLIASQAYAIGDIFTANGKLYKATAAIVKDGAIIPETNCVETSLADVGGNLRDVQVNGISVLSNGVANVPLMTVGAAGVAKKGNGLTIDAQGKLSVVTSNEDNTKTGTSSVHMLTPARQHISTFYGLAKAAGADMASSSNSVGTYTSEAKAAIQSMLGVSDLIAPEENNLVASRAYAIGEVFTANGKLYKATTTIAADAAIITDGANANCEETNVGEGFPHDVQINGTSIVSNGVANVPMAGSNNFGVVKVANQGVMLNSNNVLQIVPASLNTVKDGIQNYNPIVPSHQHESTFYGLAKAAGDSTQSASSNAVGTYTDNAKASIKSMLGIIDGSTGTVDISGTDPVIAAAENTRYVCGEVTSLSFTPPSSGISIVRFTSGSTVTVLTLPSTVKFPEWFDPTSLEINTIYEICITDGIYGAVMSWAL